MSGLTQILDQVNRFAEQHLPAEALEPAVPAAILVVATGVLISVLGARLIRPALTAGFGVGGALAGGQFACATGLPVPVTVVIAALIAGGVGYLLHRLWVGVGAAVVLAIVAVSVFGYLRILPEVELFQPEGVAATVEGAAADFELLDLDEQEAYLDQSPEKWARGFWTHLTGRQPDVGRRLAALAGAAGLVGLLLGVFLTRPTLIIYTSLVGIALVASGLTLLTARLDPEVYRAAGDHPQLLAGAGAALLLSSVILQARLYRRPPAPPPSQPAPPSSR